MSISPMLIGIDEAAAVLSVAVAEVTDMVDMSIIEDFGICESLYEEQRV